MTSRVSLNDLFTAGMVLEKIEDHDLKEIPESTATLHGGYREINEDLYATTMVEECTGTLTDDLGRTAVMGVVQINVHTPNYRKLGIAPFPPDQCVDYGTVAHDTSDALRVWPNGYIIGSLKIYDTCAIKWRNSSRYLLIPYTANVHHMCTESWSEKTGTNSTAFRRVFASGIPGQCLGSIRHGGLEAVAYNKDLAVQYHPSGNTVYPEQFLPVFSAEKPDNGLARMQDDALGKFLAQFMPTQYMPDSTPRRTLIDLVEKCVPGVMDLTREYRKTGVLADLPEAYAIEGWAAKVYDAYIKILARTTVSVWKEGGGIVR